VDWTKIGDNLYLLEDTLSQGTVSIYSANSICGAMSDDEQEVKIFEPRTSEEQNMVIEKLSSWISKKKHLISGSMQSKIIANMENIFTDIQMKLCQMIYG